MIFRRNNTIFYIIYITVVFLDTIINCKKLYLYMKKYNYKY